MNTRIPVAIPDLSGNEKNYVQDALDSTWISSSGKYLDQFESDFAQVCGSKHCLAVSNGTVALHLALLTLNVMPGDEVIVPSLTYVATANAVKYVGGVPVFVDVMSSDWCLSPEKIEDAITPRTKGIIAVHLYGHPADMDSINHIAGVNGLWVVEDAAEAPFASYKGRPTGSLATIATFSFYGNKVITSGEGGAITLNEDRLALRAKTLRGQGVDPNRRYFFPITGYNFRLTNVAAAILCAQLERHVEIIEARKRIYQLYEEKLSDVSGVHFQPVSEDVVLSPWLFCITIDEDAGKTRDEVAQRLEDQDIETRPFFIPLHLLPPFREDAHNRSADLSNTLRLSASGMNLPTYTNLSENKIERITNTIKGFLDNA
tara:strand:+ start:1015 stop:2136 length:1122 start_codon:yes stop_codon:yes gene_type:complete